MQDQHQSSSIDHHSKNQNALNANDNNNGKTRISHKNNNDSNNSKNNSQNNAYSFQLSFKKRHKHLAYGENYIPEEETIRNDYSLHYVLTGSRPQNQIHNTALSTRFAEYPKLKKLLQLKKSQVSKCAHPPMYIQADLRPTPYPNSFNLLDLLPTRFDVIVLDPPLQEYIQRYPHLAKTNPNIMKSGGALDQERPYWNWDELENLPIPSIAASPGFIFLWCGSGQGSTLEFGRSLLSKWGYRKCEDLVWVKTNYHRSQNRDQLDQGHHHGSNIIQSDRNHQASCLPAVFTSTKEHCLMGIRGTVRRSTDGHFVHCNVDTDVIVSEPDPNDVLHKPEELYQLIENFCLGRRRLDLFGSRKTLRPGWLTIGNECEPNPPSSNPLDYIQTSQNQAPIAYEKSKYSRNFLDDCGRTHNLIPTDPDIDNLRPRSPPMRIAPGVAGTGIALPHGQGYSPRMLPLIGPGGSVLRNTMSGRNTISHPSGGLGRGPGNAFLPGMIVSGSRDSNQCRVFNQMSYPKSVSFSTASFNPNFTPLQPPPSSYPFIQPLRPLNNPTTWSHQPIHYGNLATAHLTPRQLSTTTHTSYPILAHQPPPYSPGCSQNLSFFPPPFTPQPYYPQHPLPPVGYPNHHQFVAQRYFSPHHLHTPQHDPSHSLFLPNTYSNLNPISNTFSHNSSSSSPLLPPPSSTNNSASSSFHRNQPSSS